MPRKIYCTYFFSSSFFSFFVPLFFFCVLLYIFNTLHIQSARTCSVPLARKCQGGKTQVATRREESPRLATNRVLSKSGGIKSRPDSGPILRLADEEDNFLGYSSILVVAPHRSRDMSRLDFRSSNKRTRHTLKKYSPSRSIDESGDKWISRIGPESGRQKFTVQARDSSRDVRRAFPPRERLRHPQLPIQAGKCLDKTFLARLKATGCDAETEERVE